jgi:hypothetical protein
VGVIVNRNIKIKTFNFYIMKANGFSAENGPGNRLAFEAGSGKDNPRTRGGVKSTLDSPKRSKQLIMSQA